jgi:hypothetical protein
MSMRHARIIRLVALALASALVLAAGAAAAGGLRASTLDVIFDDVSVGSTSSPQSVTITNDDGGPVDIGQATIVRPHPQDFLLSGDTCSGHRLDSGEQCRLSIRFRPTASGTRVAHLRLPHDGTGCTVWITLAGSGPQKAAARAARCDDEDIPTGTPTNNSSSASTVAGSSTAPSTTTTTQNSSAIRLPAGRAGRTCKSRRHFRIRIHRPRGVRFKRVTVVLNRKVISVRRGKRVTAVVNLRGLPRGRFTLRVVATTTRGRKLAATRHYVTCVKSKG